MPFNDHRLVLDFFRNHLERLPAFIEAHAGPAATANLENAILAELRSDPNKTAYLNDAAYLLDLAGEKDLADEARNKRPRLPNITT